MAKDSKPKMAKNIKRKAEISRRRRIIESSDDSESNYSTDDSDDELDIDEYRKFLNSLYPSKHLENKIKAGDRIKKAIKEDIKRNKKSEYKNNKPKKNQKKYKESSSDESEYEEPIKKPKSKKHNKKEVIETDESYEEDIGSEDSESEDSESEEESSIDDIDVKKKKFNIILTIGEKDNSSMEDESEEEEWDSCSDSNTENEDDPISTDDDSESMDIDEDSVNDKKIIKSKKNKNKTIPSENNIDENIDLTDILNNSESSNEDIINILKNLQSKNKNNSLVNECINVCEKKLIDNKIKQDKKNQKEKDRNGRIFKKIFRDKNTMNDFDFYNKLESEQQKKIIKELREINKITRIEKPYRLTLLESDIPVLFKASAMKKISSLRHMEPGSGEFYKIKNWVDTFMRIPFSEYKTLPISIEDGVEKCHAFMSDAIKTLDNAVYGLNDAKMQIMQMLGQLITNPNAIGSAIAIHGPPGTGKTSLVKEGISKILNRPFAFIALGGATDSSFLEGHGYTYEGSTWGKIVQILIDSKCMNPVIYFDELDKISDTPKGEEIAGILTHLTDTSQNSQFHDKYFSEIDFDLSKCLFIFSYNDESKINPILKDRMYRIQTKGYNQKQKTVISNSYLLPRIREQVKFNKEDIIIPEPTIHYIIENHCNKEDGVRNLKRCLEIIYTKLNLYRLMRPESNLFEEDMSLKVEFPFTVTKDIIDKLIKKTDNGLNPSLYHLYL
jgi:ATP-dependent Lon protease